MLTWMMMAGCLTRPLTTGEVEGLSKVYGQHVDYEPVRVRRGLKLGRAGAFVTRTIVNFPKHGYASDFSRESKHSWLLFVHEIGHVWQYQHREQTGYSASKAIEEHRRFGRDVYAFEWPMAGVFRPLSYYRFEQQAEIFCLYARFLERADAPGSVETLREVVRRGLDRVGRTELAEPGAVPDPFPGLATCWTPDFP